MKRMLKAEAFKFYTSYSLWLIIGVLIICSGISIFTGVYDSAEIALLSISQDSMVLILAGAIYSGLTLTSDFSNGLIRHYIANGNRRTNILLSKFLHYILGCTIILFVYPLISIVMAAAVQGIETSLISLLQIFFWSFLRSLPLYFGIFGLFFLVAVIVKKGAITMAISVPISILLVVFTNRIYSSSSTISILKYTPIVQLQLVAKNNIVVSEYWISVLISLLILFCIVKFSIAKFSKDEL